MTKTLISSQNFDYTLSLFEKQDQDQRENLKEQATTQRSKQKKNVDVIVENVEESVIEETASNLDETQDAPLFDTYMGELGKY